MFTSRNYFFWPAFENWMCIIYSGKTNLVKEAYVFCLTTVYNPRPPKCTLTFKGESSLLMDIKNTHSILNSNFF